MEKLKMIEAVLIDAIADELSKGIDRADTEELYKAVDILKDIEMVMDMKMKNMTKVA